MKKKILLNRFFIRNHFRKLRRTLCKGKQLEAAIKLYFNIINHNLFKNSKNIAMYIAKDGEIDPCFLLYAAQNKGKAIYLPVITNVINHVMLFQHINNNDVLTFNKIFKVAEPFLSTKKIIPVYELDLILLPIVAFDKYGNRLGMGGGFYDRALSGIKITKKYNNSPKLIGVAHQFQQLDYIETHHLDVKLEAIVTDNGWVYTK